jgi:tetratricopeptide (TPR) repeat protein
MTEHLLGSVHLHKGEFPEARTHFERAVEIRTEIGDISGVAASQNNIGNVLARTGHWEEALEFYVTSCETDARLGDKLGHASTLCNIASVHLSTGKPDQAIPILEESIAIEMSIGDQRGLAISLLNLNLAYYLKQDYSKAMEILRQALEICERNSLKYECIFCYNGLCELYSLLGDPKAGLDMAQKSYALSKEMGTREGEAMSLLNEGSALLELGLMDEAKKSLESALAIMEEINHNQIFDACLSLGNYWKKAGDPTKARLYLERALIGYEKNKDERNSERCKKLLDDI